MTIIDISMSEILPLWMVTSHSNGGLDYDPIMIGYILIIASGASIGLQPIYNLIEKRVKRLLIFRICIIFVGLLIFLIPYTNLMNIRSCDYSHYFAYKISKTTFAQFLDTVLSKLIHNSNKIRYKKNYIQLEN